MNYKNGVNDQFSDDLKNILNKYDDNYLINIISVIEDEIQEFVVEKKAIIKEEVRVSITRDGYFKRSSLKSYVSSGEDSLPAIKGGDIFVGTANAFTTDTILYPADITNSIKAPAATDGSN